MSTLARTGQTYRYLSHNEATFFDLKNPRLMKARSWPIRQCISVQGRILACPIVRAPLTIAEGTCRPTLDGASTVDDPMMIDDDRRQASSGAKASEMRSARRFLGSREHWPFECLERIPAMRREPRSKSSRLKCHKLLQPQQ
jgi:hypothetical protein